MAQLVQLEQGVVEVLELEMRREQPPATSSPGAWMGQEIVRSRRYRRQPPSAGVLAGGALDTGAAQGQAVLLGVVDGLAAGFQILFDVAVGGLVLNAGHCARLEHIGLAEELLGVAVDVGLILAREVQVDIRLLVTVEARKVSKGMSWPSTSIRVPQWGQSLSGRSKPSSTLPSVMNSLYLHLGQR